MPKSLKEIYESISRPRKDVPTFWIPELWLSHNVYKPLRREERCALVNPYEFLKTALDGLLTHTNPKIDYTQSLSRVRNLALKNDQVEERHTMRKAGDWLCQSSIYGIFMRNFTAFDHNNDGVLGGNPSDITQNNDGVRETGTFLKALALLPYIKSLGFNTIYLLPVSLSGRSHLNGELPSPYSIKNPLLLDPLYHDPLLGDVDIETEFKAFVEACHILSLRVIVDFALRTASRDSDWIAENPDWFYWIPQDKDKDFHSPDFSASELLEIKKRIKNENFDTIPPDRTYIEQFYAPPRQTEITLSSVETGYVALSQNQKLVVPGAFCDWPPDDIQPPWKDITYLKLYSDKEFNYTAYNTVRMYDKRLSQINESLWEKLSMIIPHYQKRFGIDGARIDMAHALPKDLEMRIIQSARETDFDFGLVSEDFNPNSAARDAGYNAVYGDSLWALPRVWMVTEKRESFLKAWIRGLATNKNPMFGIPESPDSPRAVLRKGGVRFSESAWVLVNTLPNVIPFCMSGFELGDKNPTNLGIDFTREEIEFFKKTPLAFYNRAALQWNSVYHEEMVKLIQKINHLRKDNSLIFASTGNFIHLETVVDGAPTYSEKNPSVAFMRSFLEEKMAVSQDVFLEQTVKPIVVERDVLVALNLDMENERIVSIRIGADLEMVDVFHQKEYKTIDGELNLLLKPGEFTIAVSL